MKLSPIAQTPLEWFALKAGLVPTPLAYSHFGFMASKFLLEAVDKGIFEAIAHKKLSLQNISDTCKLNLKAVNSLLGVLGTMGLVKHNKELFHLTAKSKKWLLRDSPNSLYWVMIFDNRVCLKWMDNVGSFLETGRGLQYHQTFNDEEWFYYQKAMEAAASATSKEAVNKISVPAGASKMLDIGGAHGLYSVALCKKYFGLTSIILDLPGAVEKAAPILAKFNMGDRIKHQSGDVLTDDLGKATYNVVLMASVAHHFTAEQNKHVAKKVFESLSPGGMFIILEVLRAEDIQYNGDMLSAIGDFFFALTSTSGTWSLREIKQWQKEAGFLPYKKSTFLTIPGYVAVAAQKP